MRIRELDPVTDLSTVTAAFLEAADYWLLADRAPPDATKAAAFFTDAPPGCDPSRSHRLGLFVGDCLNGLAELSFGFPENSDAYLRRMILSPQTRGQGHGRAFLARVEGLAHAAGAPRLYLAVLKESPRGEAFWMRQGFRSTGVFRQDADTGHVLTRLVNDLWQSVVGRVTQRRLRPWTKIKLSWDCYWPFANNLANSSARCRCIS